MILLWLIVWLVCWVSCGRAKVGVATSTYCFCTHQFIWNFVPIFLATPSLLVMFLLSNTPLWKKLPLAYILSWSYNISQVMQEQTSCIVVASVHVVPPFGRLRKNGCNGLTQPLSTKGFSFTAFSSRDVLLMFSSAISNTAPAHGRISRVLTSLSL